MQLASLVSTQSDALVGSVDSVLLRLRRDPVLDRAAFERAAAGLVGILPSDALIALSVVDARGDVLHSTIPVERRVSIADRPHFLAHLGGEDRLHVGAPVFGRVSGRWAIQFTRPILVEGRFAGVLAATISPQYLAAALRRARLDPGDMVALFTSEGAFLARSNRHDEAMGQSVAARPFLGADAPDRGTSRYRADLDGVERIFGWQRTGAGNLVAVIGIDVATTLAGVERRRGESRVATALAAAAVALLATATLASLVLISLRQRELADSRERFTDFARASGDWFWETDAQGRFTWMSDGVERAVGVAARWHYGKRREDLAAASRDIDAEPWRSHLRTLARREAFRDFRYLRQGPDREQWLSTNGVPRFDAAGEFLGYRGSASDVTHLVQAEQRASRAETMLVGAVEALNENVIVTDAEDRIALINAAGRASNRGLTGRIVGMRYEDFLRKGAALGYYPGAEGAEEAWIAERIDQRRRGGGRIEVRRQDGRWTLVSDRALDTGGIVTVALDITELKQAQQELHELNQRLERRVEERTAELRRALREQESFSYTVSHDLRAPLRAINGFASILLSDHEASLPEEARRLLSRVASNAIRMGELIDGVLELSRLGRTELQATQVSMAVLVRSVSEQLREGRAAYPVPVIGALPDASGDPLLLRQVWQNLLGNAFKFSSGAREPRVEVAGRAEPGRVVYWVRDNGVGFDMAYADKLFGVFQRLHGADEFSGSGVGLAIVKRAIERHGGETWAEGRPGEGATFYFSIPS